MQAQEVAHRYARALFDAPSVATGRERVLAEMREIRKIFEDKSIAGFLGAKNLSAAEKRRLFDEVFAEKPIHQGVKSLISLLGAKGRLELLPWIAGAYEALTDEEHGVTRGTVKSATTLAPDERQRIEKRVSEVTGKKVILSYKEDPSMVGGLTAEVGGYLFDDSIKSHLRRIKEDLKRRTN
jgi:F-type H+-transporting ATPase subunit delta